jgi:hypothetical protein
VSQPEVDVETFDETDGCTFTATVEVRPTFDAPDHEGIDVTFPEWDVEDDEVDEQLEQLRERFAEVDEVEREAATGDLVTLDLRVEIDGEELESANVEDALYEIGSQGVTPKLDEELVGKSAGDEITYEDTLPDEYPDHGGEPATFHVTVKDVREKTLPELDDDFATTASGFDTIDELRKDVRDSLLRRKIEQAQHDLRGRILEAYLARVEVPLPEAMVEADKQARMAQLEQQAERFGIDVDDLLAMEDTSSEDFEDNAQQAGRADRQGPARPRHAGPQARGRRRPRRHRPGDRPARAVQRRRPPGDRSHHPGAGQPARPARRHPAPQGDRHDRRHGRRRRRPVRRGADRARPPRGPERAGRGRARGRGGRRGTRRRRRPTRRRADDATRRATTTRPDRHAGHAPNETEPRAFVARGSVVSRWAQPSVSPGGLTHRRGGAGRCPGRSPAARAAARRGPRRSRRWARRS